MQKLPEPSAPRQQRLAIAAANLGQWMLTRSPPADDPVIAGQLDDIDRTRFDSRRISLSTTMLQDLSALKLPLLLIWGAQDKLAHPTPQSRAASCRDVQPDAQIEILEGAGHWVQYEQAGAVNQLMLNFHRASD
jgi:pimeloyl-ACP methyl ester carboxylesterase